MQPIIQQQGGLDNEAYCQVLYTPVNLLMGLHVSDYICKMP